MQNIHIIYTQYTKVQSVYIIRQAIIDKRTKPFCFYEWYWIRVCATQFRYELSITRKWQEVVQTAIRLGNTAKEFLISLRSTVFE